MASKANKGDLIEAVQSDLKVSGNAAAEIVNTVLKNIEDLTIREGKLGIARFGTFEVKPRAARKGRDMKTGEQMIIPATKAPGFKAAKEFKTRVKES